MGVKPIGNTFLSLAIALVALCALTLCQASSNKNIVENPVMVCYWGTWSHYRLADGKFTSTDIDPHICTHLIYSFFLLDTATYGVRYGDPWLDLPDGGGLDMITKTIALKNANPDLKVTMAIGGWNDGSINYSIMASDPAKRRVFVTNIISIIQRHGFDGIDMDWEYPAKRDGRPEDKQNFVILLQELRAALDAFRPGLLLTSAFGCGQDTIEEAYDIPEISKYLDYFHLMLYDFKVYLDPVSSPGGNLIGHHSPLHYKEWETEGNKSLSVEYAVQTFIDKGAPPEKLVLGVGTYGKTYALQNRNLHHFYDPAQGPGSANDYTQTPGMIAYYEICLEILNSADEWTIAYDVGYAVPYAYSSTKWIGYDNEISAKAKVDYGASLGVGGMMIWSLEMDDFKNLCGGWTNFPIVRSLTDRMQFHSGKARHNK